MKGIRSPIPLLVVLAGGLGLSSAAAQESEPLRTRNLAPLVAVFGLPTWETAASPGEREFAVVQELASHFRLAGRYDEQLIIDGETWRTSFLYKQGMGEDWTVGIEVPVVRYWGGVLDNVIDGWHSTFNLPDGDRNLVPNDRLSIRYLVDNETRFSFHQPQTGLGDTQVSLARQLRSGLLIRAIVKLPTGDEQMFAGSGSTDVSVTLFRQGSTSLRSRHIGYYWGIGLMQVGKPTFIADRSEDWAALGVFGAGWQLNERFGFKGQLDFHSRFYDSALDELGKDSIQASIGGWWTIDDRRRLSFAINEDLVVRTAPDVSFHIGFSWAL